MDVDIYIYIYLRGALSRWLSQASVCASSDTGPVFVCVRRTTPRRALWSKGLLNQATVCVLVLRLGFVFVCVTGG